MTAQFYPIHTQDKDLYCPICMNTLKDKFCYHEAATSRENKKVQHVFHIGCWKSTIKYLPNCPQCMNPIDFRYDPEYILKKQNEILKLLKVCALSTVLSSFVLSTTIHSSFFSSGEWLFDNLFVIPALTVPAATINMMMWNHAHPITTWPLINKLVPEIYCPDYFYNRISQIANRIVFVTFVLQKTIQISAIICNIYMMKVPNFVIPHTIASIVTHLTVAGIFNFFPNSYHHLARV